MAAPTDGPKLDRMENRGGAWVAVQVILLAAILLSALVGLTWPGSLEPIAYAVGAVLLAFGIGLLATGGTGLAQSSALTPFPAPRSAGELRTTGVYRLARHPMYGGGILIGLGWSAIFATPLGLALTATLAVFVELKSRHEERGLEQRYPGYADYRAHTRHRLIPYVW
jgi:protein-S-isoprenylcysteine O-methyltransferase Ste14